MSGIDADLGLGEREALIDEVAAQLPLWLQRAAEPRPQPVDQLADLLGFTTESLRRVRAVHALLSDGVTRLLAALPAALRSPRPASERPVEIAGVVRGPVDWAATARLQAAGQAATFVVMPRRRVFDTPEHRALAWVLHRLDALCAIALQQAPDGEPRSGSWTAAALHARRVVAHSRRVAWLAALRPERPDHRARTRIHHSRNRFAAGPLSDAIDALIDYESAEGDVLAALIAERYFTPEVNWRLFEVVVLIRIDRALAARAGGVRRYLMSDTGVVGRYTLPDGDRVELRYQGWGGGPSRRADTLVRHGCRSHRRDPTSSSSDPERIPTSSCSSSRRHATRGRSATGSRSCSATSTSAPSASPPSRPGGSSRSRSTHSSRCHPTPPSRCGSCPPTPSPARS